jgi:hypothetical protein
MPTPTQTFTWPAYNALNVSITCLKYSLAALQGERTASHNSDSDLDKLQTRIMNWQEQFNALSGETADRIALLDAMGQRFETLKRHVEEFKRSQAKDTPETEIERTREENWL